MSKWYTYLRWVIAGVLSAGLLYEGGMKVAGKMSLEFHQWGFPVYMVYIVGALQLFGALGLFHRKTVSLSLFVLVITTMAAILTIAGKHASYPTTIAFSLAILWPILYLFALFTLMYLKAKRGEDDARWGMI